METASTASVEDDTASEANDTDHERVKSLSATVIQLEPLVPRNVEPSHGEGGVNVLFKICSNGV
jgi:hypothetical protein